MFCQNIAHLQWLHVLVATIAYFLIGAVWYSPVLFSKAWIKATGLNPNNPEGKKGLGALMAGSFVLMLVTVFGLAVLLQILPAINALGGIKLALLIGVCFSFTSMAISFIYEKRPWQLYAINGGYHIVGIAVAGAILAGWQ